MLVLLSIVLCGLWLSLFIAYVIPEITSKGLTQAKFTTIVGSVIILALAYNFGL